MQEHTRRLRALLSDGLERSEALARLRDSGVSPISCVKALQRLQPLEVSEARSLVESLKLVARRESSADASGETPTGQAERSALENGIAILRPPLEARGFLYAPGDQASSSGGPFAVGFFRRGELEIGLIVRHGAELGGPSYSVGPIIAGHEDLVRALGGAGKQLLVKGEWVSFKAKHGGSAFEALRDDLVHIVLPVLDASETAFLALLERAWQRDQERLGLR